MQRKLVLIGLYICSVCTFISCDVSHKIYQYTYNEKKLEGKKGEEDDSKYKVQQRPIKYPATKDLQIKIVNYNPLKEDIIIEDTAISYSIGDTAALSKYLIFPTLPKPAAASPVIAAVTPVNNFITLESIKPTLESYLSSASRSVQARADCIRLDHYQYELNQVMAALESDILFYKSYLSKIERINDDLEYLKSLDVIDKNIVTQRLSNSFLSGLQSFTLPDGSAIDTNPSITSSRELNSIEETLFTSMNDVYKEIEKIDKEVNELDGNCDGFNSLLKTYLASSNKVKSQFNDFKTTHTEKIIPSFSKKLLVYDQLKKYATQNTVYITRAIPINKDYHSIKIYKKEAGASTKVLHDEINVEPNNGFKLSVAGGIFFSNLSDQSYSKKSLDSFITKKYLLNGQTRDTTLTQTYTQLYEKDQSQISYGGMLYLEAHSQTGTWFNGGMYLGFGALFNDQTRWAGALGGSFILGKPQKFSVHIGAVTAQIDRLAEPYQTGVLYPERIDNIPTQKVWKVSGMVGFSWSFK